MRCEAIRTRPSVVFVGDDEGFALGLAPLPGGFIPPSMAGMPPFVLHAAMPTASAAARNSAKNGLDIGPFLFNGSARLYSVHKGLSPRPVEPLLTMQNDRALPAANEVALAREEFYSAQFEAAAQRLAPLLASGREAPEAALLAARVEMRHGSPAVALQILTRHLRGVRTRAHKAETALLKGVAFARLGDPESARAQFEEAREAIRPGDDLDAELIFQIAASLWIERRLDEASASLDNFPQDASSEMQLQARILKGAIASAAENLPAQGAILLDALRRSRDLSANVYLHAMLVTQIAALSVELPSTELRDAANQNIGEVRWTGDISDFAFHALRAIAWRHALDGDEFSAFRRLKEAVAVTRSPAWRVAALTDRAYLASALGEQRWAAQELRDAHELAATIDWNAVAGEEKLALPILAEMFAERDPSVAINYAATFRSVGSKYPRVLSSANDRRIEALEAYSLGKVQAELGELDEARRLLSRAYGIYDRLGIQWRAARAALALAKLGDEEAWRAKALEALRSYPRSWLLRDREVSGERRMHAAASPKLDRLTPAQRAVFDLLMDGRGTVQIAKDLNRSTFTVRNHIKAIFKVFGVTSRPALIVKASQS